MTPILMVESSYPTAEGRNGDYFSPLGVRVEKPLSKTSMNKRLRALLFTTNMPEVWKWKIFMTKISGCFHTLKTFFMSNGGHPIISLPESILCTERGWHHIESSKN
jgi:hypothetical protein